MTNCPILREPIKRAGMTAAGSIYEYSAIKEWFTRSDTDPCTGLRLPTRQIYTEEFDDLPDYISETFSWAWSKKNQTLLKTIKKMKPLSRVDKLSLRVEFSEYICGMSCMPPKDFRGADLKNLRVADVKFYEVSFARADLRTCRFHRCRFVDCNFMMCQLAGTRFVDCIFTGHDTIFNETRGGIFIGCSISDVDSRTGMLITDEIDDNLRLRGHLFE